MSKKANIIISVLFLAFIYAFGLLIFILPDREFSENENRELAQKPVFSLAKVIDDDDSYMSNLETYITDQFPIRDTWIKANSLIKTAMLKKDISGVFLGDDGYLLEVFNKVDDAVYNRQLIALNRFASFHENEDINYYFALVPNSVYVLADKLPPFAQTYSQKEYIDKVYSDITGDVLTEIDVCSALTEHSDEYIYYRTDHHWTSLGAYYGYTAIANAMGITPTPLSDYSVTDVSTEFKGTFFSKGNFVVEPDIISRYDSKNSVTVSAVADDGEPVASIYNESKLEIKDKYTYFLGGNPSRYEITTSSTSGKTLVMIKDSYSHSLVPFFLEHYSKIIMIDLRYTNKNINDYIKEIAPDDVLIVYNAITYSSDTNVNKLAFEGAAS